MNSSNPTLLFISNNFCAYGGGNCVLAWSLQALCQDWDITFFCPVKPDFESINRHFGTRLKEQDFKLKTLPFPLNVVSKLDPDPFSVQQLAWLMRFCRKIAHNYDVVMTCDDEVDFGRPGVQYTHFPHMQRHSDAFRSVEGLTDGQRLRRFLTGRLRPWLLISGISLERIKSNLMVTNSNWTADVIRECYGVESVVVYPPVLWGGADISWQQRRNSFVCLGRLSPVKRLPEMIRIIEQVRNKGYDVELEIIGDEDAVAGPAYVRQIRDQIAAAGDWVRLHQSVSRRELESLVANCRYGVHGMLDEHFGIAPAELMRAGCVVFVPDSGGQVEIIGGHPELRYHSDEDAVEKICRVLGDEKLQARLAAALRERSAQFSEARFMHDIKQVVADFSRNER